jgi:transcriptional regulator GlxA family with amidase domain
MRDPRLPAGVIATTAGEDLALRTLRGEDDAIALLTSIFARLAPKRVASGRPSTVAARRSLAADAREALSVDPSLGLVSLARAVGASPPHLSRVFRDEVGVSVSRYRRQLRLRRALEGLGDDLARVAAGAGFADHAHLSREARTLLGRTPSQLRGEVAGAMQQAGQRALQDV